MIHNLTIKIAIWVNLWVITDYHVLKEHLTGNR